MVKRPVKDVNALTNLYDLILWIIPVLEKFPKSQKFLIADRIETIKYKKGHIELDRVNASVQSWIGHVCHANSYRLREELFSKTVFSRSQ